LGDVVDAVGGDRGDDAGAGDGVILGLATGSAAIAELWADSPATTLPGTLWRLFLVREWIRRDPELVAPASRRSRRSVGEGTGRASPRAPVWPRAVRAR